MERIEFIRLDAARATRTPEGWIRDRPVLTRAGVFTYRNADGTMRREFRPPEEVFDAHHLASMQGVPVTTAENHNRMLAADEDGVVIGAVCSAGQRADAESMDCVGDIVIHHPSKLGTRRELSLGYRIATLDPTPGEWKGQKYDAVQRGLTVNHCAVVARGRAGNARLRLDAEDAVSGDAEHVLIERKDEAMADTPAPFGVEIRLDNGIAYRAAPEVEVAYNAQGATIAQLRADADAEKKRADGLAAERDEYKRKLKEVEDKAPQVRADALSEAKARVALEAVAKAHGVEVRADASDKDIRLAVLKKLRPETDYSGQEDIYTTVAFDFAVDEAEKANAANRQQRVAVNGGGGAARSDAAAPAAKGGAVAKDGTVIRNARDARDFAIRAGTIF